jgi:glutathione S-transferase
MVATGSGGSGFGLPELSPYVTKTEVQLKMAGVTYRKEQAAPDASPKGQLPYIVDDGEVVADSTFIRAHIERKYGADLDRDLDARARAEAWAIERMIENHFTWIFVYARWIAPANFEKGSARLFDNAPKGIRAQLRQDVRARVAEALQAVNIGRHSGEEIVEWVTGRSWLCRLCSAIKPI